MSAGRDGRETAPGGPCGARTPLGEPCTASEALLEAPGAVSGLPFVVLFAGSRHWADPRPIHTHLAALAVRQSGRPLIVRHGDCPDGADKHCAAWVHQAAALGWDVTADPHPADWDHCGPGCPSVPHRRVKRPGDTAHPGLLSDYCPTAGPRRNRQMVALGADLMVAAPFGGSYGTRGCMTLARSAGIPIDTIWAAVR